AHEFFDALPIHVFQSVESRGAGITISANGASPPKSPPNEWRELLVAPTSLHSNSSTTKSPSDSPEPDFTLTASKIPTPHTTLLPLTSPRYAALLPLPGSTIEISPESLSVAAQIARRIGGPNTPHQSGPPTGAALILDYGPSSTIPVNSLRGI